MRKILLFVAVLLFMAVPVMAAGSNVTISCSKTVVVDTNWVTVTYVSDNNLIRAFGLDITVEDGNIIDVCDVDPNYRIFPGQISIIDGDVNDYYQCYDPCDLGDANLAIEMGSLYTTDTNYIGDADAGYGKKPQLAGTLLKFAYVNGSSSVIDVNVRRGGVVMEDPYEIPDVNLSSCQAITCTVPNIIGLSEAAAEAAITGAGLSVGAKGKTASCGAGADFTVATQNPAGGGSVDCGSSVDFDICECYYGQADYAQWEAVGKPICWCYPRQCKGDADGLSEGKSNYWVSNGDLTILKAGWNIANGPTGSGACADFDHAGEGKSNYRVSNGDLTILKNNWNIANGPTPTCTPGNR